MNKKYVILSVLIACVFAFTGADAKPKKYTEKFLKGSYVTSLNGMITFFGGQPVLLPTWFTGVLTGDGKGTITNITGKFNVGGCLIVNETGNGTYTVNPDGTGSATATVENTVTPVGTTNNPCPNLGLAFPPSVKFDLEFTIVNKKTLNAIAVSLKDAAGNPIVAFGASGQAQQQ